ncbi:MAG TPA: XrtA system polysaccharide deacetylase [Stellaceae bacterium]|nr:XrtA system polysaccharide deacetylase [Stellaceae bacterium]
MTDPAAVMFAPAPMPAPPPGRDGRTVAPIGGGAGSPSRVTGAMTIDVEDYFQVEAFAATIDRRDWDRLPSRVERNVCRLLDLLAEAEVEATFFTLGGIVRRHPQLARRIVAGGHELASHGTDHGRVDRQSRAAFRADIRDSKHILEDAGGVAVHGYRAPTFSIGRATLWAHAILAEEGYRYSSSVYPIRHDLYGSPGAPRAAFAPCSGIIEVPLTAVPLCGLDVPASGGGYFRLFPYPLTRWLLRRASRIGAPPAIFYLHPWEIDPEQPRQRQAPLRSRFRHYLNLHRTEPRLRRLLRNFAWTRMDRLFLAEGSGPYPLITAWTDHRARPR